MLLVQIRCCIWVVKINFSVAVNCTVTSLLPFLPHYHIWRATELAGDWLCSSANGLKIFSTWRFRSPFDMLEDDGYSGEVYITCGYYPKLEYVQCACGGVG